MILTVLIHNHDKWYSETAPWVLYKDQMASFGVDVSVHRSQEHGLLDREHEALLLHLWTDWWNFQRFQAQATMELMCQLAKYRARFPKTKIYACADHDDARCNYILPFWRETDTVLYRIPPYDRSLLFPYKDVWAWEYGYGHCYGRKAFVGPVTCDAAFVGSPSGPQGGSGFPGYRETVAAFTAKVGYGYCGPRKPIAEYDQIMSGARIIVCPRGWGQSSSRHWDAWRSGKPVLTDRDCSLHEMIPGQVLEPGKHFLVFDNPFQIPDLVSDWSKPSRKDDLDAIAAAGREAVEAFDCVGRLRSLFG
jgi:hypothetical protein